MRVSKALVLNVFVTDCLHVMDYASVLAALMAKNCTCQTSALSFNAINVLADFIEIDERRFNMLNFPPICAHHNTYWYIKYTKVSI
jgi:hypothetical protein